MKKISSANAYNTNADIFLTDGTFVSIDYDFQDRSFFDSADEAEEWLKDEMANYGIEYDEDALALVCSVLWAKYTA